MNLNLLLENTRAQNFISYLQVYLHIFTHKPLDTMDQRYLSFSHAPIVSPLYKVLKIELYNDKPPPSNFKQITNPSLDQPSCALDIPVFTAHTFIPTIPSAASLFEDSTENMPLNVSTQLLMPLYWTTILTYLIP